MSGDTALRVLLDEAGMSNTGLGRAVVTAGAKEGIHRGTNTTSEKRMLDGCQPRWPAPRPVAAVLSRRLQRKLECRYGSGRTRRRRRGSPGGAGGRTPLRTLPHR
ncbi:MAG: hypothetical protein ACRDRZ_04235 [Pseudonocardiaceae bacterium]